MRTLILFAALLGASSILVAAADVGDGDPTPLRIFEVSGAAPVQHVHGPSIGAKSFVTKANKSSIIACITGDAGGPCSDLVNDAGGKAYLYIFDARMWGLATSPDPETATITMLEGLTDGKGKFMFSGEHAPTGTVIVIDGKAKLDKAAGNQLVPLAVKGNLKAVSVMTEHHGSGKFKTVGKPIGE